MSNSDVNNIEVDHDYPDLCSDLRASCVCGDVDCLLLAYHQDPEVASRSWQRPPSRACGSVVISRPLSKCCSAHCARKFGTSDMHRRRSDGVVTSSELTVLIFDIDYFKRVNDTYGHSAGYKVLGLLAAILREQCRA